MTKSYEKCGFPGTVEIWASQGFIQGFIGFMACPWVGQAREYLDRLHNVNYGLPKHPGLPKGWASCGIYNNRYIP